MAIMAHRKNGALHWKLLDCAELLSDQVLMTRFIFMFGMVIGLCACTAQSDFYSFRAMDYVALDERPARREFIGRWQSVTGEQLELMPDGRFVSDGTKGCWDIAGQQILFRLRCANYGNTGIVLALAEETLSCTFERGRQLLIMGCRLSGAYSRFPEN